jgi:hypothetical protein
MEKDWHDKLRPLRQEIAALETERKEKDATIASLVEQQRAALEAQRASLDATLAQSRKRLRTE